MWGSLTGFILGVLMLVFSLYLVYRGRQRPDYDRPAFMEWAGMEALIAMLATTGSVVGLGLAGQAVVSLTG